MKAVYQHCDEILASVNKARREALERWTIRTGSYASLTLEQRAVLILLHWRNDPGFSLADYGNVFTRAAEASDLEFFKAVGRVLESEPAQVGAEPAQRIDRALIEYWCDTTRSHPPLCFFTDEALLDILDPAQEHGFTLEQIRKRRQRLGLVTGDLFHVRSEFKDGKSFFVLINKIPGK